MVLWLAIVRSGPDKDRFCSPDEREYIEKKIGIAGQQKITHPWKAIFTSLPFLAIAVSHFSENWGFYTLLTQLPTFLKGKHLKTIPNFLFLYNLPFILFIFYL